jgi:hypothetical protein
MLVNVNGWTPMRIHSLYAPIICFQILKNTLACTKLDIYQAFLLTLISPLNLRRSVSRSAQREKWGLIENGPMLSIRTEHSDTHSQILTAHPISQQIPYKGSSRSTSMTSERVSCRGKGDHIEHTEKPR